MAKQGQGVALDPPGPERAFARRAKPLDLKYMKINGFLTDKVQGLGPCWGLGRSPMLA